PYAMAGVSVFAADSDEEGAFLATSMQQQFVNLRRGRPGPLPPPVESMDGIWSPLEAEGV
ncbi:MAG TPA: LLM class flavin-dependent oxidoreductase, partial [Alcanivorax sp.]|nr:LLM class flavin-dependent oxidoreductase [Alcanivorax sp.]